MGGKKLVRSIKRLQSPFNLVGQNERISLRWVDFRFFPAGGMPVDAEITWMKTHMRFLRSVSKYRLFIDAGSRFDLVPFELRTSLSLLMVLMLVMRLIHRKQMMSFVHADLKSMQG